jgi:hypothetical protein
MAAQTPALKDIAMLLETMTTTTESTTTTETATTTATESATETATETARETTTQPSMADWNTVEYGMGDGRTLAFDAAPGWGMPLDQQPKAAI